MTEPLGGPSFVAAEVPGRCEIAGAWPVAHGLGEEGVEPVDLVHVCGERRSVGEGHDQLFQALVVTGERERLGRSPELTPAQQHLSARSQRPVAVSDPNALGQRVHPQVVEPERSIVRCIDEWQTLHQVSRRHRRAERTHQVVVDLAERSDRGEQLLPLRGQHAQHLFPQVVDRLTSPHDPGERGERGPTRELGGEGGGDGSQLGDDRELLVGELEVVFAHDDCLVLAQQTGNRQTRMPTSAHHQMSVRRKPIEQYFEEAPSFAGFGEPVDVVHDHRDRLRRLRPHRVSEPLHGEVRSVHAKRIAQALEQDVRVLVGLRHTKQRVDPQPLDSVLVHRLRQQR